MSNIAGRPIAGSRDSNTLEAVQEEHEEPCAVGTDQIDHKAAEPEPNIDQIDMEAWRETARGRQLRVLISGLGGVGKSTLINQLLRLKEDDKLAKEGRGGATTLIVSKHERTTEQGVKVCLFDTPGFGDPDIEDEDIIAMMKSETEKRLDVVFYCISLDGPCRVQRADVQAIKIMTQAFTGDIWKKAVIVLTFANTLETKVANGAEYKATITQIQEKVQQVLRKDHLISEEVIAQLPIVTAGHSDQTLKYEVDECKSLGGWNNRLFLKALEQVDPEVVPILVEVLYNWKDLVATSKAGPVASTAISIAGTVHPGLGLAFGYAFAGSYWGLAYEFILAIIRIIMKKYREWWAGHQITVE